MYIPPPMSSIAWYMQLMKWLSNIIFISSFALVIK
jgi:hypothetical protein